MARISQYQVDTNISDNDQLLGTDAEDANVTKKFTVGDLSAYINGQNPGSPGSGTVTSVTGTGSVSGITLSGTVTASGELTLGGALEIDSADITSAIGYTPYDASNPDGFTSFDGDYNSLTNKPVIYNEPAIFSGGGTPTLASGVTAEEIRTLIGAGDGTGSVESVSGTAPIISSGGATPVISISAATTSAAGSMSAADKTKLDGISVFKSFAVDGQTTVVADSISDTLTLVAGNNITIATDDTLDTITIDASPALSNTFIEDITVNGVLIGAGANENADENTRIGKLSLGQSSGNFNTAVGWSALRYNSTGQYNTAIGNASMSQYIITGSSNVGVGYRSLRGLSSGLNNVAVGNSALVSISGGNNNIAIGSSALDLIVNSSGNIGLGTSSLGGLVTGEGNVAIGSSAGGLTRNNLNDSVFIGHGSSSNSDGQTNQIVIGALTTGNGSNTVTLGNDDITDTYLKGNVNIPGDLEVTGDTIGVVGNNTDTYTGTAKITQIVTLSQAEYDASSKLDSTLYIIL